MNPQDRTAVRTASDIERKYNLKGMTKQVEIQKDNLYKLEHNLNNFANSITKDLANLQDQVDGNITTWFSNGEPTLENYPVNEWRNNETHLGDLYYDSNSGYSYRFAFENGNYCWIKLTDSDVTKALELAKNAQDTADGKRRIFTITPIPPYDIGDLWLDAKDLYVCVKSKLESEIYEVDDFEIATKYTDDSALNNFINEDYKKSIEQISNQIDKKAETWCQNEDPSIKWLSEELKKEHIGDLWYKTDENKNYIYTSSYTWSEIDGVPDSIYDEIDGKAQIFTSQPIPPYYKGDLYTQGSTGDILVCAVERLTGNYINSDWVKASKYTDDTNLNNFVNVTYTEAMKSIKNQIDSKITTWYYKGEPTLTNVPAIDWTSDEIKDAHSGDLYYDQDTGYCYRFQFESDNYTWLKLTDVDVTKALAMANSAQDTADSKRRIFLETPSVPYDNGDMWIKDQEIYVCQISKDEHQIFNENDFIVATKYTDNTLANQVNDRITVVAGQVTTIEQNVSKVSAEMQDAKYYIDEEGNKILITDQINKLTATAYGLNQVTTSVGGNNVLRNTGLWFVNDKFSKYKVSGTTLKLVNTLDAKISPKQYGYTKQNVYSGKNKNVNAENVIAGGSSPEGAFTNLSEYDGYKNVVEVSTNIAYMTLRTNEVSNDLTEKIVNGGIDITSMLLIKKTNVNTRVNFYLGSITGGAVYNELKHYKDEANGWAWYYTTHTIPTSPTIKNIQNHISSPATNFATFYIAKIQTLIGSTPSDFEPYVGGKASPSPEYPQEIEVASKDLFNLSTSIDGFLADNAGTIAAPNTATKEKTSDFIEVKENETIVCTLTATIPSNGYIWWGYIYYDSDKTPITERASIHNASNKLTLTVPTNAKYFRVSTRFYNDGVLTIRKPFITTKSITKNIVKNSSFRENLEGWVAHSTAEIVEKLGQKCLHIPNVLTDTRTVYQDIKDRLELGKTYTMSCNAYVENYTAGTTNLFLALYFDGRKKDGSWGGTQVLKGTYSFLNHDYSNGFVKFSGTFKIPEDTDLTKPFRIFVYSRDNTADLYVYDLQIEPGDIDTDYQEFQESTITYDLGNNFFADKDYIENGILNKNVGKVVLNGSEEGWSIYVATDNQGISYGYTILLPLKPKQDLVNVDFAVSNRFKQIAIGYVTTKADVGIYMGRGNNLYLKVPQSILLSNNINEFKTWLSENPVTVYYELETPEQIPLETTGELRTFEPNTIITNDLDSEMEVEYEKNSNFEYWDGYVKRGSNERASNFTTLLLQNDILTQEHNVTNGEYSVSFYYRKLIELASVKVRINDDEYLLDSMEIKQFYTGEKDPETGEYITKPINVSSGHLKVEFICDVPNGAEIFDLMCNKGSTKLAYSQNQNETTTDTVNISKGITITSSADENTKFKADYDGVRILNKNDEIKTKFTDKGTETDELVVRKKATITGLLHQEVDDQTWVTKI